MNIKLTRVSIITFTIFLISLFTVVRLFNANYNASFFIVAGSDFVDSNLTLTPILVQKGQGYDGQFFYKYAINPLNFDKFKFGVNVDLPNYRMQRIGYPLFVWLIALGNFKLVPFSLIITNVLAFIGVIFFSIKIVSHHKVNLIYSLIPLLFCGLYMSLSRNLSEVFELFCFSGCIYYFIKKNPVIFCFFAALTLLTRETSIIALAPLILFNIFYVFKNKGKISNILFYIIPIAIILIWKMIIQLNVSNSEITGGYNHLGFPFYGIIKGFILNFNFSSTKHILEFLFWILYLIWHISFTAVIVKLLVKNNSLNEILQNPLAVIYFIWLIFAILFTEIIYIDDWGFMRIFSLWNFVGFVILVQQKYKLNKSILLFSVFLVFLTLVRLSIRV